MARRRPKGKAKNRCYLKSLHRFQRRRAALKLLGLILDEMAKGNAIMLMPIHAELTTQQAADLLNVSRPFLIKLLEERTIAHRTVGRHRWIRFDDLMKYKERIDEARARTLDELTAQAQELDMGY